MVARPRSRRGGSTLGCLFSLVLFLAALYYGVHIGQVYLRFYRLQDAMDNHPELRRVATLTLGDSFRCVRLVLWDERTRKLVPFPRLGASPALP